MKKLISLSVLTLLVSVSIFSQTLDGIPFDKLNSEYISMTKHVSASGAIQIGGFTSGAQSQGSLTVEFGNGTYLTNLRKRRSEEAELRDSKGDILRLHSAAQMLTCLLYTSPSPRDS